MFDVPNKGNTVKLQETLLEHRTSITDLHAYSENMISGDEEGNIILWKAGGHFTKLIEIMGFGFVNCMIYFYILKALFCFEIFSSGDKFLKRNFVQIVKHVVRKIQPF